MPETNSTKKCSTCTHKPLSEFHKNASNKDGLQYICKECRRAYAKTENGKAVRRKAQVKCTKTGASKLSQSRYRKTEAGKIARAKYKAANPIKVKATNLINHAIYYGRLIKPDSCSECLVTERLDAHHDDYSLPMIVRWLCRRCHQVWHKENGPGLNG
jgi:transposase-like protein